MSKIMRLWKNWRRPEWRCRKTRVILVLKKHKRKNYWKDARLKRDRREWDWRKGQALGKPWWFCNLLVIPWRKLSGASDLSREMLFSASNLEIYEVEQWYNYPFMSGLPKWPRLKDLQGIRFPSSEQGWVVSSFFLEEKNPSTVMVKLRVPRKLGFKTKVQQN